MGADTAAYPLGFRGSLDLAVLVNQWPGDLYNLFVFALDDGAAPVDGVARIPPPVIGGSSLSWRNGAYALQWWVFGLFAIYFWWRTVRDDWEQTQARTADLPLTPHRTEQEIPA